MVGQPFVVVVEERHPVISGGPQARIARRRVAAQIPIVPDQFGPKGLGHFRCVIGRVVVDHDHLGRPERALR